MSTRYSLRTAPKATEPFEGMIETPRRSNRRKSAFPLDSASEADSSAAENIKPKSIRRRGVAKFVEHIDDSEAESESLDKQQINDGGNKENYKDGEATQYSNGNGNSHKFNGHLKTNSDSKKPSSTVLPGETISDGWRPGLDPKIDYSGHFEFGGSPGCLAVMTGFPILMWYMWIGATYYDGGLPWPTATQSMSDFSRHLLDLLYTGAYPSLKAWLMYWTFLVFEVVLYIYMPGVWAYGKPLPFDNNKQLKYYCSGYVSMYVTLAAVAALHFAGIYRASSIIDEFGPLLSVAIISGFGVSLVAYVSALQRGAEHRMTGHHIYDFFMGAELNPRMFGILDFKMFFELRLPWFVLLLLSVSTAVRQYETYGYVSGEVMFLVMAHYLYANACGKAEEKIVTTWDMYYEKWGFMLIFWNMAGVPLSYCHCTIYLANHDPATYRWNPVALAALYVSYIFVYWVWDSCNGQKNSFRAQERGTLQSRNTFPQVPWQRIDNPQKIETKTGDAILVDGWYGMARKLHYTCDAYFAICWGLVTGFSSPFPWFYPVFFCCMIAHRAYRDIQRCRLKYGEAWTEYEKRVPYLFIPYVI